ncbi:hypothetical protein PVAND_013650 [Polypedilum vanderplanki]|uniref:Uncharacterized protein n=1 Tax=Polypedilum vanderplanki TaxID=319348 RepID=A0A9J6CR52_POLVA|nr:hypothetical protein PVAND_013650 [Polypedilum vanderplanki]
MASSRNGSGMKILWIPGRKRHDKKGIYKPTNKEVNKNYIQQRKNEMWTLGGASEQRKLININLHDDAATSTTLVNHATHLVDPLCIAAAGSTAACAIKDKDPTEDKVNLDDSEDKEKIVDKDILKNGELNGGDAKACNTDNIDIDADDQLYHNAGTIRFRNKKTGSNNTDLDSIEHLDFEEEEGKKNDAHLDDDIDSVSMQRMRSANVPSRRRRQAKKKNKNKNLDSPKKKPDEKVIDCLYVGLMCCECSIS